MNPRHPNAPSPVHVFRPPPRFLQAPLAALLVLAVAACGKAPAEGGGMGGMPPPEVTVDTVQPRSVPLAIELPATLAGSREVEIRARVSGILEKRNFEEGATVKQGQSLFSVDAAPFATALARQEADLAAVEARLDQARRNAARLKPLRAEQAVSQKDLDDAESAESIAAADVGAAEARVREARLNLAYTRVESPISGVAGRAQVSEGTLVSGPDVLLTEVSQLDPIHVRFGLSEQEQSHLRADANAGLVVLPAGGRWKATIKLPDGTTHAQSGVVNFSDVRIDAATGTSELQAVVPNPKASLRPGQFVRVLLEGAIRKDALVVPQRAVLDGGTGKYVYLLGKGEGEKNGMTVAQPAPVEVGDWVRLPDGENGWVIRRGLKPGDPVIVDGVARIFFPGMPVKLAGPGGAAAGAPAAGAATAPGKDAAALAREETSPAKAGAVPAQAAY
jgi:membrane fusion protein (multidrug efflux system)